MAVQYNGPIFTDQGYRVLYVKPSGRSLQSTFSEQWDPRGIIKPGLMPASNFGYRVYFETSELAMATVPGQLEPFLGFGNLGGGALGLFALVGLTDVAFVTSEVLASVVIFDGHDEVDVPMEDMPTEERDDGTKIITLPNYVYRVLYAGEEPWIKEGDSLAQKSIQETIRPSETNLAFGVWPSEQKTADIQDVFNRNGQSATALRTLNDTMSNRVLVRGEPKYISYVSIDTHILKDIVYVRAGASVFGQGSATGFVPTSVEPRTIDGNLIRYAWFDASKDGDEEPNYKWRLSESINIRMTDVQKTPTKNPLTSDEKILSAQTSQQFQFFYNLKNQDADVKRNGFLFVPNKIPYEYGLALSKTKQDEDTYDENFAMSKFPIENTNPQFGQNVLNDMGLVYPNTALISLGFSYTSPRFKKLFGPDTRIGIEYGLYRSYQGAQSEISQYTVLGKTKETSAGLAAIYNCCLQVTHLYSLDTVDQGFVLTERGFDDADWNKASTKPLPSVLKQYMLGEFPFRSGGKGILLGQESSGENEYFVIDGDKVNFKNNNLLATMVKLTVSPKDIKDGDYAKVPPPGGIALLKSSSTAEDIDPDIVVFEVAAPRRDTTEDFSVYISVFPCRFSNFVTGPATKLDAVYGIEVKNETAEDPVYNTNYFPLDARSMSACFDCDVSQTCIALEQSGRIDFVFKTSYNNKVTIIRDAVDRVAEDGTFFADNPNGNYPDASAPYLILDSSSRTIILFYIYKSRILQKRIPQEMLTSEIREKDGLFDLDKEKEIAKKLRELKATLVLDTQRNLGFGLADTSSLKVDIDKKRLRVPVYEKEGDAEKPKDDQIPPTSYCICYTEQGFMFAFIEIGNKIIVNRSTDVGETWVNIIPTDFSWIPPLEGQETETSISYPYAVYDKATNNILLFFFYSSAIMLTRIPTQGTLTLPKEDVVEAIGKLKPQLIFGTYTEDMKNRGLSYTFSVEENGDIQGATSEQVSPHRISAVVTEQGYLRLFFRDSSQISRSLISIDNGTTWMTEEQYLKRAEDAIAS